MTQTTTNTDSTSTLWLAAAAAAWTQSRGDLLEVSRLLGEQLGGATAGATSTGKAFLEGVGLLARYAAAEWPEAADAVDAEREAVEVSRRIVRPVLEAKLQRRLDEIDAGQAGAVICEGCGETQESEGRPERRWDGLLGRLHLKRRYSYCAACKRGQAPAQKAIGLPEGQFTARLEEAAAMMATTVPHAMAVGLLGKLCGIELSVKAVEGIVERRGAQVQARDGQQAAEHTPYEPSGLPVAQQQRPADALPESEAPSVAYLEMDGVVPLTRELLPDDELTEGDRQRQADAKRDKARGGKGRRFKIAGREVKNAVLYDGKDCAAESPGRGCLLAKTYVSHLGDWKIFALLVWCQILRLRFDQTKLLVVLSDGAEWIRSLGKWLPLPVLLILDLFHVKHRIWQVGHALYGEHTDAARTWAGVQCDRVETGKAAEVIEALRFLRPSAARVQKLVDELQTYLTNNLDRMDYPAYRARGLRVGSGAVESANFHVTGARLMLQGMRWSPEGAGQMAALRADLFNGRWEGRTKQLLAA